MSDNNIRAFPIFPVLLVIFITLKLMGYIAWSWLVVLWPLWAMIFIWIAIVFVMAVVLK